MMDVYGLMRILRSRAKYVVVYGGYLHTRNIQRLYMECAEIAKPELEWNRERRDHPQHVAYDVAKRMQTFGVGTTALDVTTKYAAQKFLGWGAAPAEPTDRRAALLDAVAGPARKKRVRRRSGKTPKTSS